MSTSYVNEPSSSRRLLRIRQWRIANDILNEGLRPFLWQDPSSLFLLFKPHLSYHETIQYHQHCSNADLSKSHYGQIPPITSWTAIPKYSVFPILCVVSNPKGEGFRLNLALLKESANFIVLSLQQILTEFSATLCTWQIYNAEGRAPLGASSRGSIGRIEKGERDEQALYSRVVSICASQWKPVRLFKTISFLPKIQKDNKVLTSKTRCPYRQT